MSGTPQRGLWFWRDEARVYLPTPLWHWEHKRPKRVRPVVDWRWSRDWEFRPVNSGLPRSAYTDEPWDQSEEARIAKENWQREIDKLGGFPQVITRAGRLMRVVTTDPDADGSPAYRVVP